MARSARPSTDLPGSHVPDEWTSISGALVDDRELNEAVAVHVYVEGDEFVATYEDPIPINAFGATRDEAIAQLRRELVDHLAWLEDAGDALAPRLVRQRERLHKLIGRGST